MDELLKSVLGNVMGGQQPAQPHNPMLDVLGGLLGGNAPHPAQSGGWGDLLGSVLGGGGQTSGLMTVFGMVLGGGNSTASNPLVDMLVDKLGLSPAVAQVIVTFFLTKLLANSTSLLGGTATSEAETAPTSSGGFDLSQLIGLLGNDKAVESQLQATGMPQELAEQANIDPSTALNSLHELFKMTAQHLQN